MLEMEEAEREREGPLSWCVWVESPEAKMDGEEERTEVGKKRKKQLTGFLGRRGTNK